MATTTYSSDKTEDPTTQITSSKVENSIPSSSNSDSKDIKTTRRTCLSDLLNPLPEKVNVKLLKDDTQRAFSICTNPSRLEASQTNSTKSETNLDTKPDSTDKRCSQTLENSESSQCSSSNPPKAKRKRITPEQLKELVAMYNQTDTPSYEVRESLAKKLSMTNREIQVWFQNRRAKANRARSESTRFFHSHMTTRNRNRSASDSCAQGMSFHFVPIVSSEAMKGAAMSQSARGQRHIQPSNVYPSAQPPFPNFNQVNNPRSPRKAPAPLKVTPYTVPTNHTISPVTPQFNALSLSPTSPLYPHPHAAHHTHMFSLTSPTKDSCLPTPPSPNSSSTFNTVSYVNYRQVQPYPMQPQSSYAVLTPQTNPNNNMRPILPQPVQNQMASNQASQAPLNPIDVLATAASFVQSNDPKPQSKPPPHRTSDNRHLIPESSKHQWRAWT